MPEKKNYFYGLDLIRFLAALMVAVFHLGLWSTLSGSTPNKALRYDVDFSPISSLVWPGWVGVEVFFVLSGFVIANSALGRTSSDFLKGRILRLYPAVWVCATVTLIAIVVGGQEGFSSVLPRYIHTLALLPNTGSYGWVDGVYWTLTHEIAFYFLAMCSVWGMRDRGLPILAVFLSIVSSGYIFLCMFREFGYESSFLGWIESHQYLFLTALQFRYGCMFAVGIFLWMMCTRRMAVAHYALLASCFVAALSEVYLHAGEFLKGSPGLAVQTKLSPMAVFAVSVLAIWVLATAGDKLSPSSSAVRSLLRTLGLMTYPLYLLHDIVGASMMRLFISIGAGQWAALALALLASMGLSWIVCTHCEPPIRRAIRWALTFLPRQNRLRQYRQN